MIRQIKGPKLSIRAGLALLVLALVVVTGLTGMAKSVRAEAEQTILFAYPLPETPRAITLESINSVWFTLPAANAIGHLKVTSSDTLTQYTYTAYRIPTSGSDPDQIAYADGIIWFTERVGNQIGRLETASGAITEYPIPTSASGPSGIAVAPNGIVWFSEQNVNRIGSFDPTTAEFTEIEYGGANAQLSTVSIGSDGNVWVAAPGINQLLLFRPRFNDLLNVPLEDYGTPPGSLRGLVVGNGNVPWVSSVAPTKIGTYLYGTLAIWLWRSYPIADAELVALVIPPNSAQAVLWAIDKKNEEAVQIDQATRTIINSVRLPTNSAPTSIAVDAVTGTAWIAAPGTNTIYAWAPPYSVSVYLPMVISAQYE